MLTVLKAGVARRHLPMAVILGGLLVSAGPMTTSAQTVTASSYGGGGGNAQTVRVSVAATDPNGLRLHYQWRSTDGSIANVDSATTKWTLADGPGLHFAYVLVSNGAGGYIERRIAVSTDVIGTPIRSHEPVAYRAPPAPVPDGEVYRSFISGGSAPVAAFGNSANMADVLVFAQDINNTYRFPAVGFSKSNIRGEFTLPNMVPLDAASQVNLNCDVDPLGLFDGCSFGPGNPAIINGDANSPYQVTPNQAVTDYIGRLHYNGPLPNSQIIAGTAVLADNSTCGTVNEFFGVTSTGTATLLDAANKVIAGPVRLSDLGAYTFPYNAAAMTVSLTCERAATQTVAIAFAGDLGTATFTGTGQPAIATMTATLNGTAVGLFLPPPSSFPSDVVPSPERFLSYKGIDSREDACAYYTAIGAARGCDSAGRLVSPITFDDWMRTVRIGKYARRNAPPEYTANYINKADLNLSRAHHSISYGPNQTAAYVCNHLGPKTLDSTQAEIDQVVDDNLVGGKNLVACVAMDYSASPGVNNGKPFVRFLIFGPNGQLLPSINLDGRREKFVPGTCVVCHGGDHYAGHYLAHTNADVGAHYLPYDSGNFEFSSKAGLTAADQEEAIYNLNKNVLNVAPPVAEQELIAGWYKTSHVLDRSYIPDSWKTQTDVPDAVATNFYQKVIARSCRGCHVAMVEGYNWDHYPNVNGNYYRNTANYDLAYTMACGGANNLFRAFSMPNSLVTFNRFWGSAGTADDQVAASNDYFNAAQTGVVADLNCTP
jgi:hypothetical protein